MNVVLSMPQGYDLLMGNVAITLDGWTSAGPFFRLNYCPCLQIFLQL